MPTKRPIRMLSAQLPVPPPCSLFYLSNIPIEPQPERGINPSTSLPDRNAQTQDSIIYIDTVIKMQVPPLWLWCLPLHPPDLWVQIRTWSLSKHLLASISAFSWRPRTVLRNKYTSARLGPVAQ
ncbi:hypothetical protein Dda_2191 [Drechslerella dactyloides]|uniref:Uncharacterized protein n=1 Tax=Drechslerella dactyloides TaxID=74499 RepID=A0AAD6J324_DREDA|nr:hypothetical protein Dda_2191 [Drechslerella dactyloides]